MRWAPTLTWLRSGPKMNLHRRALQPAFSKGQMQRYQPNQLRQALLCINDILDDPTRWIKIVRRFAVAVVLDISYGIEIDGLDSPWIKIAEDAGVAVGHAGAPASSLVDHIPLGEYLRLSRLHSRRDILLTK
jgi:cytochrome P450